jgi:hypothetical protein
MYMHERIYTVEEEETVPRRVARWHIFKPKIPI